MMNTEAKVTVVKFGSSVLRSEADLPSAVHEIYRHWRRGVQVVAVVSAFGDTTDELMRRAEKICAQPNRSALATLLATGEAASSALLGLALNRSGIPARVLDPVQAGLRTVGNKLDADPVAVDATRLLNESRSAVVVVPGFVGRGEQGDTTLLGRGGSDFSALFLAHHLGADCILIKDVAGLYTIDPACRTQRALRFEQASYETALHLGGAVVQAKAIRYASTNKLRFTITSIGARTSTEIGPFADHLETSTKAVDPLRVALLGCGTVGGGVYERLTALPELFTITGVGTRKPERARASGVAASLVTSDLEGLVESDCDVVVELIGNTTRAADLIRRALRSARDVVSANKALLARAGHELESLAAENCVTLRYSAAVGGVLPALETIGRARTKDSLRGFSGVLNGTSNFVLDRMAAGESRAAAIRAAQELGFAESDPQKDLDGTDAAEKLILLARAAFDVTLPFDSVLREGLDGLDPEALASVRMRGKTIRSIAQCRRSWGRIEASVKPVELPLDHPLAQVRDEKNRLVVELEEGASIVVSGKGAGRWPTTEAVMADLLDIRCTQREEALEACA
jgi:homoserine dehydrogenase